MWEVKFADIYKVCVIWFCFIETLNRRTNKIVLLFRKSYLESKSILLPPRLASILAFILQLFKETNMDVSEVEQLLPGVLKCLVLVSESQGDFEFVFVILFWSIWKYSFLSLKLIVTKVFVYVIYQFVFIMAKEQTLANSWGWTW